MRRVMPYRLTAQHQMRAVGSGNWIAECYVAAIVAGPCAPKTTPNNKKQLRFYYACTSIGRSPRCPAVKYYRAELVEQTVANMIGGPVAGRDRPIAHVNERAEEARRQLVRGTPECN
jgi:hypothetical protein